jgi:hypothetical protein
MPDPDCSAPDDDDDVLLGANGVQSWGTLM